MPSRERRLKQEAMKSATWRGHTFERKWKERAKNDFYKKCIKCGAYLGVTLKPMPNEIEISGPAVAIDCPDKQGELRWNMA